MMKQLREMQERMASIQEELGDLRVTGTAGGGAVSIVMDGHQNVLEVSIDPEIIEDVKLLEETLVAAFNDAGKKSRDQAAGQMGQLTAGLGLPPGIL